MGSRLKVIALISGGKDSLFSILHCIEHGHEVVALANLHPADADNEDTDSYMYQTIGHAVIPLYEDALGIPLYRQKIYGTAINNEKSYSATTPNSGSVDEVDSLDLLLQHVLSACPEANAVSTGAILSDYQRTRVESIAVGLDLTPLSYLWQFPNLPPYTQISLLEDMELVGQDARIIKVASGGLGPEHLWLNIADPQTRNQLARSMGRFGGLQGGVILGEGGEFETLTLDGPSTLWKQRIEVLEQNRTTFTSGGGIATVKIACATTVQKTSPHVERGPRVPSLFDDEFLHLQRRLNGTDLVIISPIDHSPTLKLDFRSWGTEQIVQNTTTVGSEICISNLVGINATDAGPQMDAIRFRLRAKLAEYGLSPDNITFTTILLRSMADFLLVNKNYAEMFDRPNPPARVTVACGDRLPKDVRIMLSVIINRCNLSERRGLHVQSQSYWAPANIGPYSQAVAVPIQEPREHQEYSELVYVAGQIPLVPASMAIVSTDFKEQAVLSLQHLWRIGRVMRVRWWTSVVAFITPSSAEEPQRRAAIAVAAWDLAHEEAEEGEDIEPSHGSDEDIGSRHLHRQWGWTGGSDSNVNTTRSALPDREHVVFTANDQNSAKVYAPHCLVAEVSELPRGAQIEWASLGLTGTNQITVSRGTDGSSCVGEDSSFSVTCIEFHSAEEMQQFCETWSIRASSAGMLELFATHPVRDGMMNMTQAMIIPCKSLWGSRGQALHAAVRYRNIIQPK